MTSLDNGESPFRSGNNLQRLPDTPPLIERACSFLQEGLDAFVTGSKRIRGQPLAGSNMTASFNLNRVLKVERDPRKFC